MPPKKNEKNISKLGKVNGQIVNMYEKIPKRFFQKGFEKVLKSVWKVLKRF